MNAASTDVAREASQPPRSPGIHAGEVHALAAWHAWNALAEELGARGPALAGRLNLASLPPAAGMADLPNPFAPLVDVWCLGYGVRLSHARVTLFAERLAR